jgi:hypothetical protein
MDYQFQVPQTTVKGNILDWSVTLKTPEYDERGKAILPRLQVVLNPVFCSVRGGHNVDTQHITGKNKGSKIRKLANAAAISEYQDGTIKTHINEKDFEVTLKGLVVSPNFLQEYPHEGVKALTEILKYGGALEVVSDYLLIFRIYNLFVIGSSLGQLEGTGNIQPFEIQCLSDAPVEMVSEI